MKKTITVQAHANIALIKYWGKRDEDLFLPTKSSLSITLQPLTSITSISLCNNSHKISFNGIVKHDHLAVCPERSRTGTNGRDVGCKITAFLERFKKISNINAYFSVDTQNTFPTAAGLASSASGYAALVFGLNKLCNLGLSEQQLSQCARQGSGSACRSIFGGFVLWNKGVLADGTDSFAQQLFDANHWEDLRVLVAIVSQEEKNISSRYAMNLAMTTSPFYQQWIEESEQKIPLMIDAIGNKNFALIGSLAEEDCLGMHRTMHTAKPAFSMWKPETEKLINFVKQLRDGGIECYFTIDAGPNVKIMCMKSDVDFIKREVVKTGCVKEVIECLPGGGPQIIG